MTTPVTNQRPSYPYWTYANKHLPPGVKPYWSYDNDSFSWNAKAYQQLPQTNPTIVGDYRAWLQQERKAPYPLMARRGGMTNDIANDIVDGTFNYPDLKSTTIRNSAFFEQITNSLPKIKPYTC